jgi:hypothetical protein
MPGKFDTPEAAAASVGRALDCLQFINQVREVAMTNFRHGDSFARADDVLERVKGFFRGRRLRVTLAGMRWDDSGRPIVYLRYTPALDSLPFVKDAGPAHKVPGTRKSFTLSDISIRWIEPAEVTARKLARRCHCGMERAA